MNIRKYLSTTLVALTLPIISACGGGGSSSGSGSGELSVAVTDAAVDSAERVVVEFTAVEIKPQEGEPLMFELDAPEQIDLLSVQGADFAPLISGETVPAGNYNWIRLLINDNDCDNLAPGNNPPGSFIDLGTGGIEPLHVPSGSQSGLKLNTGFTVAAGGQTNVTIDFDVRKSVTAPNGQDCHFLRPSLRLVDNLEVGHINGTVTVPASENCADGGLAVYLFEGADAAVDDIDGVDPDPITSAIVDDEGQYEIGFVIAGEYTAALTCDGEADDPETDDPAEVFGFESQQNVLVEVDNTTTADF